MKFSHAEQIKLTYPSEPEWVLQDEIALIEMVRDCFYDSSCAGLALRELSIREHAMLGDLCVLLLTKSDTDKQLKLSAFGLLPDSHLEKGLDAALGFIDGCDAETQEMLADRVKCSSLDRMPALLRNHEVVRKLGGKRLLGDGGAIRFAGSLARDEYIQADKLATASTIPFWKFSLISGGLGLIAGIWLLLQDLYYYVPGLLVLQLGFFWGWFGWKSKVQAMAWDRNPECRHHYYGTISEDGIDTHGKNSWRFIKWCEMSGWVASSDMIVLLSPSGANVFPVSYFASREKWESACALCAAKLPYSGVDKGRTTGHI